MALRATTMRRPAAAAAAARAVAVPASACPRPCRLTSSSSPGVRRRLAASTAAAARQQQQLQQEQQLDAAAVAAPSQQQQQQQQQQQARKLVVAVDHSEGSYEAVRWTLRHVYRQGDSLHLIHVVPATSGLTAPSTLSLAAALPPEDGLQDHMERTAREFFESTCLKLARQHGVTATLDLVRSPCNRSISNAICAAVEELDAALVVLNIQRSPSWLAGLFQDPVSKQVANACARPTLIFHG